MELRQLAHFVAVAEELSFTRAARRMHVVQSGLSATIAALERELGVMLFDRTTRSVELTEPGHDLLGHAREILDAAERAKDSIATVAGGLRGTLRIGMMHSLLPSPVADAIAEFHCERPGVRLRPTTSPHGSTGLVQAVTDNELDLAIAVVPPTLADDVRTTTISSEPMVFACASSHRLSHRRTVRLSELAGETFIDVPAGWGSRSSTDRLFQELGIQRTVEIEIGDVATVLDMVRAGLGVALIARSSAPHLDGLAVIRPRPAPIFTISLVLPKHREPKPAARVVATAILEHMGRRHTGEPSGCGVVSQT
ncbi:LysR family transcriptional regulator [Mycobacterium yunnanensis]|uniref:Probable hydrogen peroxide-inducible genes activator n=1 Tax=Mycobacterium yunnanensis TaxID=368477 RepID=A0A9X2YZX7_9MYCO|nr:LysR family transcriptional regulator [Mycobacterium yunnanensis]MCV7420586.1 LysR family transcriptional regulator [Mycobacterium yunnanensis]